MIDKVEEYELPRVVATISETAKPTAATITSPQPSTARGPGRLGPTSGGGRRSSPPAYQPRKAEPARTSPPSGQQRLNSSGRCGAPASTLHALRPSNGTSAMLTAAPALSVVGPAAGSGQCGTARRLQSSSGCR